MWDNQYLGNIGNKALVTLDGTDMPVEMKFSEKFMSHKFKGNGLKYKVECALQQDTLSGYMDHLEQAKAILHLFDRHLSHF